MRQTSGKKQRKVVPSRGDAYIKATFNNIIITITDDQGNAVAWSSGGSVGFKNSRQGTPYAAQLAGEDVGKRAKEAGMKEVEVFVSGPGAGRDSAIRAIRNVGIDVTKITDVTRLPHNGCRAPKKRRV